MLAVYLMICSSSWESSHCFGYFLSVQHKNISYMLVFFDEDLCNLVQTIHLKSILGAVCLHYLYKKCFVVTPVLTLTYFDAFFV